MQEWIWPFLRAFRAATEFLAHAVLVVLMEATMKGVEKAITFLGSSNRVFHLYGLNIPQQQLYDGADLGLLACILTLGVWETVKKYREPPPPRPESKAARTIS